MIENGTIRSLILLIYKIKFNSKCNFFVVVKKDLGLPVENK